ncbi:MAG: WG repeat-containing protein [Rikenellaceae bacterium]
MNELFIVEENGLYGYKNDAGSIIIPLIYIEAYSFSCGLALVRNDNYEYSYINRNGVSIAPFGSYKWCDTHFMHGYARVVNSSNKWVIINTLGKVITDKEYDKIWTIKPQYISEIKAFIGEEEYRIDLLKTLTPHILTGLKYIKTFTIEEYKSFYNVSKIDVKVNSKTKLLFFIDDKNVGEAATTEKLDNPVISVVSNSYGKLFFLLHEKEDIGKDNYIRKCYIQSTSKSNKAYRTSKGSFWDYENEKMNESYDDPLFDNNDGWSQDEIDSGLADAFEGDVNAYDKW